VEGGAACLLLKWERRVLWLISPVRYLLGNVSWTKGRYYPLQLKLQTPNLPNRQTQTAGLTPSLSVNAKPSTPNHVPAPPALTSTSQPSERDHIAFFSSLICTGARRNPVQIKAI